MPERSKKLVGGGEDGTDEEDGKFNEGFGLVDEGTGLADVLGDSEGTESSLSLSPFSILRRLGYVFPLLIVAHIESNNKRGLTFRGLPKGYCFMIEEQRMDNYQP